jgi:DNA-binding SARP family transcriptional activator
MAELGDTRDPVRLVPGSAPALDQASRRYLAYGQMLRETANDLAKTRIVSWSGSAAEAFYAANTVDAKNLRGLAEASETTALTADEVAQTTAWAQNQAREAIALYDAADPAGSGSRRGSSSSGDEGEGRHNNSSSDGSSSSGSGSHGRDSTGSGGGDEGDRGGQSDNGAGGGSGPRAEAEADAAQAAAARRAQQARAKQLLYRARVQLRDVRRDATTAVSHAAHTTLPKRLHAAGARVPTHPPLATKSPGAARTPAPHPGSTTPHTSPTTAPAAAEPGAGAHGFIGPVATRPAAQPAPPAGSGNGSGDGWQPLTPMHPSQAHPYLPPPPHPGPPRPGELNASVGPHWNGELPIPTTNPAAATPDGADRGPGPIPPGGPDHPGSGTDNALGSVWVQALPGHDPRHVRHVVVQPPVHDHHDNLWDIAQRALGDGRRWPEIVKLNRGLPQPDGHTLQQPGLVRPGWVLAVPTDLASAHTGPPDSGLNGDLGSGLDGTAPTGPCAAGGHPEMGPSVFSSGPAHTVDDGHGNFLPIALAAGAAGAGGLVLAAAKPGRGPLNTAGGGAIDQLGAPEDGPHRQQRPRRSVNPQPMWVNSDTHRTHPRPGHNAGQDPDGPDRHGPDSYAPHDLHNVAPPDRDDAGEGEGDLGPGLGYPADHAGRGGVQHEAPPAWTPERDPAPQPAHYPGYAHPRSPGHAPPDGHTGPHWHQPAGPAARPRTRPDPAPPAVGQVMVSIGVRGSKIRTLDLARQHGLGLVGAGAEPAARALLAIVVDPGTAHHKTGAPAPGTSASARVGDGSAAAMVWVTHDCADRLLGPSHSRAAVPSCVRIRTTLDEVLGEVEALLWSRSRVAAEQATVPQPPLVIFADPTPAQLPRLRTVLATGAPVGVAAILLGDSPGGTTCELAIDATITHARATGGADAHELLTTRMWTLTHGELLDRLTALADTANPPGPGALLDDATHFGPADVDHNEADHEDHDHGDPEDSEADDTEADDTEADDTEVFEQPGLSRDSHINDGTELEPVGGDEREREPGRGLGDRPAPRHETDPGSIASPEPPSQKDQLGAAVPQRALLVVRCFGRPGVLARHEAGAVLEEITAAMAPKQRLLLGCLATRPEGVTIDELMEAGWPENSLTAAKQNVHATLTRMRRWLSAATGAPIGQFAVLVHDRYHLTKPERHGGGTAGGTDTGLVWVDYWAFSQALTHARALTGEARATALTRAAALYDGPLWDDASDIDWLEPARHHTRAEVMSALAQLAQHAETSDPDRAAALLGAALEHDPTDQPTAAQLMRLHHRHGHPEQAHRVYTRLAANLAEHGLPSPDQATTAALYGPTTPT